MELFFKPFEDFITHNTSFKTQSRYNDSQLISLKLDLDSISAIVWGTSMYQINIEYNVDRVISAHCTCAYDFEGYCKHIVRVLVEADKKMHSNSPHFKKTENKIEDAIILPLLQVEREDFGRFLIINKQLKDLSIQELKSISASFRDRDFYLSYQPLKLNKIEVDIEDFYDGENYKTTIEQDHENCILTCSCKYRNNRICKHLSYLLQEIFESEIIQYGFNRKKRIQALREIAKINKLDDLNDQELEDFFQFNIDDFSNITLDTNDHFFSTTDENLNLLKDNLFKPFEFPQVRSKTVDSKEIIVVIDNFEEYTFKIMTSYITQKGKIKSPINTLNIGEKISLLSNKEEIQFYASFYINDEDNYKPYHQKVDQSSFTKKQIKEIFKNPLGLEAYIMHGDSFYETITPRKIQPISLEIADLDIIIDVKKKGTLYELQLKLFIEEKKIHASKLYLKNNLFLSKDTLYFIENNVIQELLDFFENFDYKILIMQANFPTFKNQVLDPLESLVNIKYSYVQKATKQLISKNQLNQIDKYLIYLSEVEDWITITPVIAYKNKEIAVLSKESIFYLDDKGDTYSIQRNTEKEELFLKHIQASHPNFNEPPKTNFFYLSKEDFIEDEWFLKAFSDWQKNGYIIMGFKEINKENYNTNKAIISTQVKSGIDWFDIETNISFGDQKINLKAVQKAILNKTRYVQLGDGTKGILPKEWIEKFRKYFRVGEVKDNSVRTHKSNFTLIDTLFNEEVIDNDAKIEIMHLKEKLNNFQSIKNIKIPKKLKATLRDYQKEGLNWLSFLNDFNFGGILADDMGLGKTIQIIAYFLAGYQKGETNLVVVPTSLLFNWQKELEKFAPHINYLVLYGSNRNIDNNKLEKYDLILTTYGTLISDIEELKKFHFNIIVLDESQAIKNPNSQRYKSVRLLKAYQRIAATGTPVENSTFDLYAQLSFIMPGLLGSMKKFKEDYATPIDKFQDEIIAKELQQKVHPFILRRTKKQVAKELPDKTEMVITCEMGVQQRKVYDLYKAEFQKYLLGISEEELQKSSLHVLQGLTKLRQICNSPALLSDKEYYGNQSSKIEELMQQINKLKDEHKMLIFSQFVGMLDLIKEKLEQENIKYAYLTGKTRNREEQVNLFQENDETRVFLISLKAGGTGLNLTEAEYVFIIDPWWNPAVENQAIDRAYRIGQKNHVIAIRLIVPDSIEEKIMKLQEKKLKLVEDLIHTDKNSLKNLSKDDLLGIL